MNELIEKTLADFTVEGKKIPVSFLRYSGKSSTFITYMQTDADSSISGDDALLAYVDYYDFDIYSKGNFTKVMAHLITELESVGFRWNPSRSSSDFYEDDTGFYHKTLSFAIERSK